MTEPSVPRRVVTVGDFVADLVVSIPSLPVEAARHQLASALALEPGGAGNFLIAGARLGLEMSLLGVRGDDMFGAAAAAALEREGVDTRGLVAQAGGSTTTVLVLVDEAGQHVFLGKYGSGPEIEFPDGWEQEIRASAALFLSGYSLHEERLARAALRGLETARACGAQVFFDPGPHIAGMSELRIANIIQQTDVILLTEEEIPLVAGGQSGIDAARALLAHGPRMVCVKRGGQGCVILTPAGETAHSGYPVEVRDTNAAGDSFAAAFIYASLSGWRLDQIARFANAMGAAKVQKLGSGTHVPTRDEVAAVLRSQPNDIPF
mgnify:CR=1 FL=1